MSNFNPLWFTPTPNAPSGEFDFRIDNSSVELFTTCARAAYHYSILKREANSSKSALFFGTVIHAALEVRKNRQIIGEPYLSEKWQDDQNETIETAYSLNPQPLDEWRSADQAVRVIQKYNKQYPINDEPFTIIPGTVELGFQCPIGTAEIDCDLPTRSGLVRVEKLNIIWTGRIDGLVQYDGSTFVLDHKTSSIGGPQYFEDFRISAQMHGYVWAARQLGYNAVGLLLDSLICRKPTATGKSIELQRDRYWYTDEAVDEWKLDTFTHVIDFLEHAMRNVWPKATKWCHGKYGTCSYWDVCTSPHNLRESLLMSEQFKDVTWSPLNARDITYSDKITMAIPEYK